MVNYWRRSWLTIILLVICLVPFLKAFGQTETGGIGLSVVPAIVDVGLQPPDSQTFSVTATNISPEPMPIKVDIRPLTPLDPLIDEELLERFDASSWVKVEQVDFLVDARESVDINLTVTPPADAGPGGHYVLVVLRVLTPVASQIDHSSTVVSPEVTVPIFLTVPGPIVEALEARITPTPLFSLNPTRQLSLELTNTGNTHVLVQPETIISGGLIGNDASPLANLTSQPKLILPHTRTTIPLTWRAAEAGRFKASSTIRFGTPVQTVSVDSSQFIVLPAWWQIAALALVLVVFILWFRQRRGRKRLRKTTKLKDHNSPPRRIPVQILDDLSQDKTTRDGSKRR